MHITREEAKEAVRLWGEEAQTRIFIEEIGEFLAAWNQYDRGRITREEYVSEIADVFITLQQMIFMNEDTFNKVYPKKLEKIRTKIKKYQQAERDLEIMIKIETSPNL